MRIEDYALIGDCQSAALVGLDGSIDWLCWPRFDSAACFAALLGGPEHGRWRLAPCAPIQKAARRYRPETLILETDFSCRDGEVSVIDFMPVRDDDADLVRMVVGRRGRVGMELELVLRFDYGASIPWVTRLPDGKGIRAVAGPDMVQLCSPVPLQGRDLTTAARFTVEPGQTLAFVLTHSLSYKQPPRRLDPHLALEETTGFWRRWAERCTLAGDWSEAVCRSLITLKALTYAPTGGIVAAPTTSLPEHLGGVRNWDYRICWLRDATLTLLALMGAGYYDEANAWREWLLRAVAGSPEQMQIMYGIAGERRLPEQQLGWLPGYAGSAPVRIGNAAATQLQLDVYGEVMDALYQGAKGGLGRHDVAWQMQRTLLEHLESVWQEPDEGIWEVRGPRRQFTYSKVMAWVAFDRAVKTVERLGLSGPVEHWRALRSRIHDDVCARGFDPQRRAFVQSYGSSDLDAALLLIPITGFLPATDPRMVSTVEAIQRELSVDGFVHRYRAREEVDGLPPGEGAFLACSFWMCDNLCLQGRWAEAEAMFRRLVGLCNDVGLLAEQYDVRTGRFQGNFPQAFSHVALVNSALNLAARRKPAEQRAEKQAA